jgi:hypothetical protein
MSKIQVTRSSGKLYGDTIMNKTEIFKEVADLDPKGMTIQVGQTHHVSITRTDEGVVVDIYQLPYSDGELADDPDATCYSFDPETEE